MLSLCSLGNYRILLLPAGVGTLVFLIGFLVQNDAFSLYGLTLGVLLFLLFMMNLDWSKRKLVAVRFVPVMLLFAVFVNGSVMPAIAAEPLKPTFGNGRIHVRIYSDYFCNPCSKLDPEIAAQIADLVKKNVIRVTFVDTPVHQHTTLYSRYFLYALNEKKDIDYATRARRVLFQAAARNISNREKLEAYLKKNGINYKVYNSSASFNFLTSYLTEDKVRSTPTAVIIENGRKQVVKGPTHIAKAIGEIK